MGSHPSFHVNAMQRGIIHTFGKQACMCLLPGCRSLQGDVLDRGAYEKAAVSKAHAVILGSLQSPDAKAADARMLTRWA